MDQDWLVNKPRILAVRSEPAEPRPGETVTFEALLPDPTNEITTTLWLACPPNSEQGLVIACMPAADAASTTTGDEPTNGALVIGMEPMFSPQFIVPKDTLDNTDDKNEGIIITIEVIGMPDIELDTGASLDLNVFEIGTKGLVVSEALTPNHNPDVVDFFVNGESVSGEVALVDAGATVTLSAKLHEDSVETYSFISADGSTEDRTEEPYASWYTTCGSLQGHTSLFPYLSASWTAPTNQTSGTWWIVIRDRRGGMAWWKQHYSVN